MKVRVNSDSDDINYKFRFTNYDKILSNKVYRVFYKEFKR